MPESELSHTDLIDDYDSSKYNNRQHELNSETGTLCVQLPKAVSRSYGSNNDNAKWISQMT